MTPDKSANNSGTPPTGAAPNTGAIIQKAVLEKITQFCHRMDNNPVMYNKSNPLLSEMVGMPLEFAPRLENPHLSSMDRLKQNCRLEDLVRFVTAEIRDAKLRDRGSFYATVSKHQYVGILRSFFKPERNTDEWLPLAELLTDYLKEK